MCWVATLIEAAVFGPLVEVKPVSATANRARQQRLADRTAQTALQTCAEACVQSIDAWQREEFWPSGASLLEKSSVDDSVLSNELARPIGYRPIPTQNTPAYPHGTNKCLPTPRHQTLPLGMPDMKPI